MSWWQSISSGRAPRSTGKASAPASKRYRPPPGRSVYETRKLGWRAKPLELVGRGSEKPSPIAVNESGSPTYVTAGGRVVGVKCEDGSVLRFPEPPADRPDLWPKSWWQPVGELRR